MKAMILAAGRGERMRPLTDSCPKPLLMINGKPLIVYHLESLCQAGITDIIVNVRYLAEQIQSYLGNGQAFGVNIVYSVETFELEVGGGINRALPLLGDQPFIVVNSDIWTDYPFAQLKPPKGLAHLVMVDNPQHHPKGDFNLKEGYLSRTQQLTTLTYSGISVLHPSLFQDAIPNTPFRLATFLDKAALSHSLTGEHFNGKWVDVGTIERLQFLEHLLAEKKNNLLTL
ncbi:MAG: nucleotidyltransferase family protein [Proteobacteria bacterium]|nr:nucleotidyltransferase family protein [Pseudomonadota bacterium]